MRLALAGRLILGTLVLLTACAPAPEKPAEAPVPAGSAAPAAAAAVDATVPSADGVAIHYHAEGNGEPAIVFIHCWSCNATFWKPVVEHLAPTHRVVTLDLGGHGSSGRNRAAWTIPAFAQDVRAVVEALGLKRVVLVGHSMGGYVIVETARLMPDKVVALVPVDTLQDVGSKWDPGQFKTFIDSFRKDFPKAVRGLVTAIVPKGTDPALIDRVATEMGSTSPEVAIPAFQGAHDYDVVTAIKEVKVPIHAINGDLFPTKLEENRRYAPQFDADIIAGCGHFPMFEAPDKFNQLLDAVLQGFALQAPPK